ncbi:isoprenylcysteine carboxylmethyltransferase family protein [Fulvimarina sp. 2208YS6-2-32]|uniref:Isoprenylcysteine carboxylmethyltransferase family protein n=1 Tax=Fulvimarina uroteuthidis TaxID=3098149 RepID=A0ABU5I5S6_9HYPH|nr:isoprenylcysteine carboxylmethyltransferase family protein [Fulvimarina sp. 2208YS6-2-32]MDY8110745.1 isoprenylcysteine carboxylmethyltransferase family protein [Fulvimarina sp. 2208YS6-2-32]
MAMRDRFPDLPPVWAAGFFAAEWIVADVLPIVAFGQPVTALLGAMLAVCGFAIAIWAAIWFGRKKTAIEPGETPKALIVEGPFRINRNPIYTGMALVLLGVAVWLGALSAVIVALGFPFVITARFIRDEEAALRKAFGQKAERYFAGTRRW